MRSFLEASPKRRETYDWFGFGVSSSRTRCLAKDIAGADVDANDAIFARAFEGIENN